MALQKNESSIFHNNVNQGVKRLKLHQFKIEGFRRHYCTEVLASDATFLIGENNIGKSSVLSAINYLLNDIKKMSDSDFYCITIPDGEQKRVVEKVILTAEFRNLADCCETWRGFKGRVLTYPIPLDSGETGKRIIYRKTFEPGKDYVVELLEHKRSIKPEFEKCTTMNEFFTAGLDKKVIDSLSLSKIDPDKKITKTQRDELFDATSELFNFDQNEETWVSNPGGIPGNVLIRLPKFLLIPAKDKVEELTGTSGTLVKTLNELFNDIRDESSNYKEAQKHLTLLAQELDPTDSDSEVGKMMLELNNIMGDVFPRTGICAEAHLSDPNTAIKPQFKITMYSNIATSVELQGTGMIRAAVFALLRYRSLKDNKKDECAENPVRPLLIGFEEPEIYLHPNAAHKMRDTIYELASSSYNQIICTTHSPYMIDLSKKPKQVLNNFTIGVKEIPFEMVSYNVDVVKIYPFNVSDAFLALQGEDRDYIKMLLKVDDYIAKVFFAENVLIVEGDTEEIVLRESLARMPEIVRTDILSRWQIIKARGKAVIISLVKYLNAMGINPVVIHDEDKGVEKAEIFNKPILEAIGDQSRRFLMVNCIEDMLGYNPQSKDKPYKAYKYIKDNWQDNWDTVSPKWKAVLEQIFHKSFALNK